MGCSKNGASEKDNGWGILSGHAYSVLKCLELEVRGKSVRLLKLRNPWGTNSWKGAWVSLFSPFPFSSPLLSSSIRETIRKSGHQN